MARATCGPRTTESQRTTTVASGPPSTQVTGYPPRPPQVAATRPGSLTRKRTEVQAYLPAVPHQGGRSGPVSPQRNGSAGLVSMERPAPVRIYVGHPH
jgi:hypothetical protein